MAIQATLLPTLPTLLGGRRCLVVVVIVVFYASVSVRVGAVVLLLHLGQDILHPDVGVGFMSGSSLSSSVSVRLYPRMIRASLRAWRVVRSSTAWAGSSGSISGSGSAAMGTTSFTQTRRWVGPAEMAPSCSSFTRTRSGSPHDRRRCRGMR